VGRWEGTFGPARSRAVLTQCIALNRHRLSWEEQIQDRIDEISGDLAELRREFDRNIEIIRRGFEVIAQLHELDLVADRRKRKPLGRTRRHRS
jgi:hypothetical protein